MAQYANIAVSSITENLDFKEAKAGPLENGYDRQQFTLSDTLNKRGGAKGEKHATIAVSSITENFDSKRTNCCDIPTSTKNRSTAKRAKRSEIDILRITGNFDVSMLKSCNMYFFTKYVTCNKVSLINFCMRVGLLPCVRTCSGCRRELRLSVDGHDSRTIGVIYRCTNRNCRKGMYSVRQNTVFQGSQLQLETILKLIVLYVGNITSYEQLQRECVDERGVQLSARTVSDWLTCFREIQLQAIIRHSHGKIGGPGCMVQIYECKIWKRKLEKYEDMVCGICCESVGMFAEALVKPDSETMIEVIAENVAEGSTVITDCWERYDQSERDKWVHLTANYNLNFVDPLSGAHNHSVECTNWQIRRSLPTTVSASSDNIVLHAAQYVWRRKFARPDEDVCLTFIRHIRESYPAKTGERLLELPSPVSTV